MSKITMSKDEREAFLADLHVAVLAMNVEGGAPLLTPVWYAYEPGGPIRISVARSGIKGRAVETGQVISLCVQDERPPYKYVTIEGSVEVGEVDYERDSLGIAERYLGVEGARAYMGSRTPEAVAASSLLLTITPTRWKTVDYGKE